MDDLTRIANKCLTQAKNRLYFQYTSLAPAIFRMETKESQTLFGTDAQYVYADPSDILMRYKRSPEFLMRSYLHLLFHCIYLHPFLPYAGKDTAYWNVAMDICCEAAIARLDKLPAIPEDQERAKFINDMKQKVKMFLPDLVYKELMKGNYDLDKLQDTFHMDSHLWMLPDGQHGGIPGQNKGAGAPQGQKGAGTTQSQDQNKNSQKQQDGPGQDGSSQKQQDGQDGSSAGQNSSQKNQGQNSAPSATAQQGQQDWSDVAQRIATDMQSFNKMQGTDPADFMQEIDYLTKDKMDYSEFLRTFSVMEERMMINQDEFDYAYYMYGLTGMQTPGGVKATDKQVLLIEPLEYKDDKVIKDFVIAIDTSGSCAGELVQKFLKKTYSILKESESFSTRVNIHIIQCDAKVQEDTKITNKDEMEYFMQHMTLHGFGGTDFRPVFQYVDQLIKEHEFENLCGLIYFTDGYGTYPTTPTPYKTAFTFLEDYEARNVPPWAMSVFWKDED